MIYWTYAAAQAALGETMLSARVADWLSVLVCCVLVYVAMKRLVSTRVGIGAALLYGVWYFVALGYWDLGQGRGVHGAVE